MIRKGEVDIGAAFDEGSPIDAAIDEGIREAIRRHRLLGQSIVVWRDGKVVKIPADEIPDEWWKDQP